MLPFKQFVREGVCFIQFSLLFLLIFMVDKYDGLSPTTRPLTHKNKKNTSINNRGMPTE